MFAHARLAFAPRFAMHDLRLGDAISGHIAYTGLYELTLSRTIVRLARSGGLFVDVGANMGYFSLLWAAARPENRVVAFEASPRVAPILAHNVAKNGLEGTIRIEARAASDQTGTVKFNLGPDDQTGWGGIADQGIDVASARLDEVLAGQDIAALKIDVEGAEALVLRGADRLLRDRLIHHIFFEQNDVRERKLGPAGESPRAYLARLGYRTTRLTPHMWHAHL